MWSLLRRAYSRVVGGGAGECARAALLHRVGEFILCAGGLALAWLVHARASEWDVCLTLDGLLMLFPRGLFRCPLCISVDPKTVGLISPPRKLVDLVVPGNG